MISLDLPGGLQVAFDIDGFQIIQKQVHMGGKLSDH